MERVKEARPRKEQFLELAQQYEVVPVVYELTSDTVTPFTVFSRLARCGRNPFLLESVEGGERVARYSFIGVDPWRVVEIRSGQAFVDGAPVDGSPLEILRRYTAAGSVAPFEDLPPFAGGAVGHVGYDAVRLVEVIPDTARDETGLPEAWFGLYDGVVALDRARQRLLLVALARVEDDPNSAWEVAMGRLAALREGLEEGGGGGPQPHADPGAGCRPLARLVGHSVESEQFLEGVAAAREYILAGDIFQVVLSRRWREVPRCRAAEVYRMLRLINPSPYMFFLEPAGAHRRLEPGDAGAGSRRRGHRPARSPAPGREGRRTRTTRLAEELLADPKERAEHVMLVDLGRNDVGRVAQPGTVEVTARWRLSATPMSCTWSARCRASCATGCDALGCALRLLPGRHPVRRAEGARDGDHRRARGRAARRLRRRRRIFVNSTADMDICIAIRTLVEKGGVVHGPGGRRHRLRLGAGERARGVSQQGVRPSLGRCRWPRQDGAGPRSERGAADDPDARQLRLLHLQPGAGAAGNLRRRDRVVRNDDEAPDALLALGPQAVVISPGPGTPEQAGVTLELIRAAADIPLLGVCLGEQAMGAGPRWRRRTRAGTGARQDLDDPPRWDDALSRAGRSL